MLYAIKNKEDLRKLKEAVSLESQVKVVRLQDKLGEQIYHEHAEKLYKPVTDTIKSTTEKLAKDILESSIMKNEAKNNLNNKILEIMNDRGIIASYLLSLLSKITNPKSSTQFKLVKDSTSNRVFDLLIHNSIPFILQDNLLTFRDTNKQFEMIGDLLKMITNKNYNIYLASLSDEKLLYEFAKKMNFDLKAQVNKSTRDKTLTKLLQSSGLMVSASGVSKTLVLPSNLDELCQRLKTLLQEKQAGNNSDIKNNEFFAIVDKLSEYKC